MAAGLFVAIGAALIAVGWRFAGFLAAKQREAEQIQKLKQVASSVGVIIKATGFGQLPSGSDFSEKLKALGAVEINMDDHGKDGAVTNPKKGSRKHGTAS